MAVIGATDNIDPRCRRQSLNPTLNCRVVRTQGGLVCEVQTTKSSGVVGQRLRQVVESLSATREYAETRHQRAQIDHTIEYLTEGDVEEFLPADCVEPVLEHRENLWRNLVLMHEIIGHGSGTYNTAKYGKTEDPVSALGALGGALEEQRADLTALVFVDDPKLIEIGAVKDADAAALFRKLTYDVTRNDLL